MTYAMRMLSSLAPFGVESDRLESPASPRDVGAVLGDLPFEVRLRPLRVLLELLPLRLLLTLRVSLALGRGVGGAREVCTRRMGGCVGSDEYETGGTSQWARKCSPRTLL